MRRRLTRFGRLQFLLLIVLVLLDGCFTRAAEDEAEKNASAPIIIPTEADEHAETNVSSTIISLNFEHVQGPYLVSVWLMVSCIAKICFHIHEKFGEAIPDSALLIGVGLLLGFILNLLQVNHNIFYLPSEIFFLYLLPPIIFDAGYFMPVRQLVNNFGSVMMFAVLGTIWNTVTIGATLAVCARYNLFTVEVTTEDSLLFSSLISAVDPVAVITVFEELHVNEFLFINVFGEALFNDGIAAVLFQIFKRVALIRVPNLAPMDYISFTGSFFAVALGGVGIGLVFAVICAIATKYTERVKIVGPVFVFVIPYLSYLTAEMFGLSAILAICTCGIAMKQYVRENVTHEAAASVKYFVKMLAQSSETAVFMFLGLSTMSADLKWDVWFIVVTMSSCLVYRALGVVIQCAILNMFRTKKFTFRDQFVMSYGGLRGAIAFGLLSSVPDSIPGKDIFTSTTLVVILITVFIQGTTIRPLLSLLKVETKAAQKEETLAENVFNKYFDYTVAGVEDIIAQHSEHSLRDWFERMNAKYVKPLLVRHAKSSEYDASAIVRAYHKIAIQDALNLVTKNDGLKKPGSTTTESQTGRSATSNGFIAINLEGEATPQRAPRDPNTPGNKGELYRIVNQLLDQRLAEFKHEPVVAPDEIDDIPDEIRPNLHHRRRSRANLPGMASMRSPESVARDLTRELAQNGQQQRSNSAERAELYRVRPTNNGGSIRARTMRDAGGGGSSKDEQNETTF